LSAIHTKGQLSWEYPDHLPNISELCIHAVNIYDASM